MLRSPVVLACLVLPVDVSMHWLLQCPWNQNLQFSFAGLVFELLLKVLAEWVFAVVVVAVAVAEVIDAVTAVEAGLAVLVKLHSNCPPIPECLPILLRALVYVDAILLVR